VAHDITGYDLKNLFINSLRNLPRNAVIFDVNAENLASDCTKLRVFPTVSRIHRHPVIIRTHSATHNGRPIIIALPGGARVGDTSNSVPRHSVAGVLCRLLAEARKIPLHHGIICSRVLRRDLKHCPYLS